MYAETGILSPCFQGFSQEAQFLEESCRFQNAIASRSNLVQTTVSEYDLGGEGDLFRAPEPIIEQPMMGLDPMTAAISMISFGENVISPQTIELTDIESIRSEQLLSEVFYECKKDLLAKSAIEESLPKDLDVKNPSFQMEGDPIAERERLISQGLIQKSVSVECLSSMESMQIGVIRPNFLDFQGMDFETAYGMRRAFSEGDIQTLGSSNTNHLNSHFERPVTIGNYTIEERLQRLSRYRKKKTKRNFVKKIKYACRKALADSQPRIRGRFAKTEESEVLKN